MLQALTNVTDRSAGGYVPGQGWHVVSSTSQPQASAPPPRGEYVRSFVAAPEFVAAHQVGRLRTAVSDDVAIVVGPRRAADRVIRELVSFRSLSCGWDGESAKAPNQQSITDAIHFAHAAVSVPGLASRLQATMHGDGSVILEIEDDPSGSLSFTGDGQVVFCMDDSGASGVVNFEYDLVPDEIKKALLG